MVDIPTRIVELPEFTGTIADTDVIEGVVVSDTTDAESGTSFKWTWAKIKSSLAPVFVSKATYIETVAVALSDMNTAITTGTTKAYWVNPWGVSVNILRVFGSLSASGTGSTVYDINEGAGVGTSILSTKITIDTGETHSDDAATPPVISDTVIAAGGRVTFDIDSAATGAAGPIAYMVTERVLA